MSLRNLKELKEICDFLRLQGYTNVEIADAGNYINIPDRDIRIQINVIDPPDEENVFLFIGTEDNEGINWQFTQNDYLIFVDGQRYYLANTESLKEFIELNNFKNSSRVHSHRNSRVILIKIKKSWLVYGLMEDVKVFYRLAYPDKTLRGKEVI